MRRRCVETKHAVLCRKGNVTFVDSYFGCPLGIRKVQGSKGESVLFNGEGKCSFGHTDHDPRIVTGEEGTEGSLGRSRIKAYLPVRHVKREA